MEVNLRFAMHRDVELIHQEKDCIDGLVIPAHILSHQATSTAVFVTSLSDKPYIVDPMTYVFQNAKSAHLNDEGNLRASVEKMCTNYHKDLSAKILALRPNARLAPGDFPDLDEVCENVIKFQKTFVQDSSSTSKANKYIKRYAKTQYAMPRLYLPPYFYFGTVDDEWYKLSLTCAKKSQKLADVVAPVICCPPIALDVAGVKKIVADYDKFSTVLLWFDNLAEGSALVPAIAGVRSLIASLVSKGKRVESLFGGYLSVLFHFDGLSALSHGILYAQHKSTQSVPGGGGVPERYYIPMIHDFRSLSQTDLILHKHRELMCDCEVCKATFKGNPDNIIRFRDNPDLLRQHFLAVRRQEADAIEDTSIKDEVKELKRVYTKYHNSFQSLPNPDAIVSEAPMQGLAYLKVWADAFDE